MKKGFINRLLLVDDPKSKNYEKSSIKENQRKKELKSTGYNKSAIIGFVFSVIAIFGFGLFGIIGFILGIVALTQIKHTKQEGRSLAISAIIIGLIWGFIVGILKRFVEMGY